MAARGATARAAADQTVVAGVRLSHPDRLIYPELGFSKADLARYYAAIERWILPHVKGRPLTLVHCPEGVSGECRFLRHAKAWGPTALQRVRIREKTKVGEYLVAQDVSGVVALAQMGIVEIHTWNSTIDDLERPNRLIWDLDPGPEVAWPAIAAAARLLRGALDTLGLVSWVKTTGGRGAHVVVPIVPRLDWSACLAFARDVAEALVRTDPGRFTIKFSKQGRERKILIDYLRNNRTNTSVCAFSPRAKRGAPVSMPLAWEELRTKPDRYTVETVPRRLARLRGDPWDDYWSGAQDVPDAAVQAVRRL
jgi:bifunctional non-homologous end joining protein LigD